MNVSPPYVGILVASPRQRKRVLHLYAPYVRPDIQLFSFTPRSVRWGSKRILGMESSDRSFRERSFPFPQVVYNRYYRAKSVWLRRLATENVVVFNLPGRFDKWKLGELLGKSRHCFGLPETLPYTDATLWYMLDKYGLLFLKPERGCNGKGVYRLEKRDSGEVHIAQHHIAPFAIATDFFDLISKLREQLGSSSYIIQQGIRCQQRNGVLFDIRALVQKTGVGGWSVTHLVSRVAFAGCFNTSVCEQVMRTESLLQPLLPEAKAAKLLQHIRDRSIRVAETLEKDGGYRLGEVSVDYGLDEENRLWMIECNAFPQKSLYRDLGLADDVYRAPMEYASFLCDVLTQTELGPEQGD